MIRVWHYWVVRPKTLFFLGQFALLAVLLLLLSMNRAAIGGLFTHAGLGQLLLLIAFQFCLYLNGLDELIADSNASLFLRATLHSLGATLLLAALVFTVFPRLSPGFGRAAGALALSALVLFGLRYLLRVLIRHRKMVENLLILGTGDLARKFYAELARSQERAAAADRVIAEAGVAGDPTADSGLSIHYSELRQFTLRHGIRRIVVAEPNGGDDTELAAALLDCKLRGLEVEQAVNSYEKLSGKIWLEALPPQWLIYSHGFRPSKCYLRLKSVMDRVGALLLVILTSPLLALIALAIRLSSPGPMLFRQLRVGRDGKNFVLYKFRSMRQDAEQKTGPKWAAEQDNRVTTLGKWLRKFRLDELPQAFNVLRGDMSLVGPRPERPYFVNLLRERIPYYGLRTYVKPGITGWAQVYYPYGSSIEDAYEKLQYDLYYTKHMSLAVDLQILFATLKVVLFGRGR